MHILIVGLVQLLSTYLSTLQRMVTCSIQVWTTINGGGQMYVCMDGWTDPNNLGCDLIGSEWDYYVT